MLIPSSSATSPVVEAANQPVPKRPSKEFCAELQRDPLVVEWFISIGENEGSRKVYLWWFAVFCLFTGWTPQEIINLKRKALQRGEPKGEVESALRRFYSALCSVGYAGKTSSLGLTACYSFLNAHGFPVPRRLIRMSYGVPKEIRLLEEKELEGLISQAGTLEKAVLFTVMAECPARPRIFPQMQWSWLEEDWYKREVAHISLPTRFRPRRGGGSIKFEPICYAGPRGTIMLKKLRDELIRQGRPPTPNTKIFSSLYLHPRAINFAVETACARATKIRVLRERKENEESISPKSFRKFVFNIIDSLEGISPEWRAMLKGRDLGVEKYYSKANIEALRKIYREKIYPAIWSSGSKKAQTREEVMEYLVENLSKITDILAEHEGADLMLKRESMKKGPENGA
jgi:hypothetical protein